MAGRLRRLGTLLAVMAMSIPGVLGAIPPSAPAGDELLEGIRARIESAGLPARLAAAGQKIYAERLLPSFYESRAYRPAWVSRQGLREGAFGVLTGLERAGELAEYLLRGDPRWTPDAVRRAMNSGTREETVRLPSPVPVHLYYMTAWAEGDGSIQFRPDVYGRDAASKGAEGGGGAFRSGRARFAIRVHGLDVPYERFFATALPGDTVEISVSPSAAGVRPATYMARLRREPLAGGGLERIGPARWRWIAPRRAGRQRIVVRRTDGGEADSRGARPGPSERRADLGSARRVSPPDSIVLTAFVLVPAPRLSGGSLAGYRMGTYPTPAYRGLDQYRPPEGFIRLTRENESVRVSPHFTLGQFPVKRPYGWPKYLPLGPKMLLKLELLLEEVNRRGIRAPTFTVMSAFRSPWYNTTLLDRPRYSRHIYGDAADVFVDADGNGYMDDLNGDGRITLADAEVLYRIVQEMDRARDTRHLRGGLWKYRRTSNHPPFIHVDTRGFIAR